MHNEPSNTWENQAGQEWPIASVQQVNLQVVNLGHQIFNWAIKMDELCIYAASFTACSKI